MKFISRLGVNADVIKYLLVGMSVFIFYSSLLYLSIDLMQIYYPIGFSISYLLAITAHFTLNKKFTFDGVGFGSVKAQFTKYVCLMAINYFVSICTLTFAVERLFFSVFAGVAMGIVLTTSIGFFASKYWIFRGKVLIK
jgi:putative flippase GtrA